MQKRFQRVAHRGGARLAPENTLAAFRNALTLSIDAVELDVQMSCDGHAIVFHDASLERLTDGTGNILDRDFAYLRSLDAAAHFPGGWPQKQQIPTLHEVLALAKSRVRTYIEIKASERDGEYGRYPGIVEAVIKDVRAAHMQNQVLVMSFDWSILTTVDALDPLIETGMIVGKTEWSPSEQGVTWLIEQAKARHVDWINLEHSLFDDALLEVVHEQGLKLGLWTVNSSEDLQRFAQAGVDSLTTDRPDLFAELAV
jgi:glycerophosphoryl diester phosphodiesterase